MVDMENSFREGYIWCNFKPLDLVWLASSPKCKYEGKILQSDIGQDNLELPFFFHLLEFKH